MQAFAKYWTMLKLSSDGHYQPVVQPLARSLMHAQFPDLDSPTLDDDRIQHYLFNCSQPDAQLCLRCYLSHAIAQACESLVRQFGTHHRFQINDLLPLVLDDDATLNPVPYQPLSLHILKTFQPSAGSLTSWAIRQVRQHADVKQFLLEHGVYLISPWALLNDTKPEHLPPILTQFYRLHPTEVHHAYLLLESYRSVYLPDRLQQRLQHGNRTACSPPTSEQLHRICELMQEKTQMVIPSDTLLKQLQTLAQRLRQYRLARRGGVQSGQSFDEPESRERLEYQLADKTDDPVAADHAEFLQRYRQSFQTVLQKALAIVIQDRVQKAASPQQSDRFLVALQSYYCQQLSMGEIAAKIGIRAQDAVSRLLSLKPLRADVRHQMSSHLKTVVFSQAAYYVTPEQLQDLDCQIQAALDEQLEAFIQAESQRDKTPKGLKKGETHFSKSLCHYLDQIIVQRQDSS